MADPDDQHDRRPDEGVDGADQDTLDRLIHGFRDHQAPVNLTDPHAVAEQCFTLSEAFAAFANTAMEAPGTTSQAAEVISGVRFGEHPAFPGQQLILGGHAATLVHLPDGLSLVVDWTAHQFPDQRHHPVPRVATLVEWRTTWAPLGGDGPEPAAAPDGDTDIT